MSNFRDNHAHFTGSLPVKFIWQEMKRRRLKLNEYEVIWKDIFKGLSYKACLESPKEEEEKLLKDFEVRVKTAFSNDHVRNIDLFFNLYSLFQHWTKAKNQKEMQHLYIKGTESISQCFNKEHVGNFEIIAGPLPDWDKTRLRIDSMIIGLKNSETKYKRKNFGRIRLTFISDGNSYKNYSKEVLIKIFQELKSNKDWVSKISGFDFSGVERVANFDTQKEIIDLIKRKGRTGLTISVHGGEDLFHNTPDNFIDYFEKMLNLEIDKICHGTFLWVPNKYLHLSKEGDQKRIKLLTILAKKGIELELCPTANLLLSPLNSYNEIPVTMISKMGINYSVNTDNKSIFSTNLEKEYRNLNLPL